MTAAIPQNLPDADYRHAARTLREIAGCGDELRAEIAYDGVKVAASGEVLLTIGGEPVARCRMSGPETDADLIVEDD